MSNHYFTSDTHFDHEKIISFGRPFENVDDMNEQLIENWNKKVKNKSDFVYIVGDYAFANRKRVRELNRKLRGQKVLILGNHDHKLRNDDGFVWTGQLKEIKIEEQKIVMCHYAMRTWNGQNKGAWQLFGHSHGRLPLDYNVKSFDVGIDPTANRLGGRREDYRPASFEEIKEWMSEHEESTSDYRD